LELQSRIHKQVQVLSLRGRIDHDHSNGFESSLLPHVLQCSGSGMPLVLDFSGVDFISSVGLRVLMIAAKQVKLQQGRMAVCNLTPVVQEVFQVSRFNLVLKVYSTVDDAALALVPPGAA
jgi:anti-sigma B factor antagonist